MAEPDTVTAGVSVILVSEDPARRPDVLFRARREPGTRVSAWWMVGAFVLTSLVVIAAVSLLPSEI